VNDKGVSFRMSHNEYIEIFHKLMNVGRISHPIRVSPKPLNNPYMFKKGGTSNTMCFLKLKEFNKLSRLASLGLNNNN